MAKKRFKSLDEKIMGPEPLWDETNPCPSLDDPKRDGQWSQASHWYDYFYKSKEHIPTVLKYCKEELGYKPKDIQALKKLPPWKLGLHAGSWCRIYYRGWEYSDEWKERMRLRLEEYLIEAKKLKKDDDKKKKTKAPVISPIERTRRKMYNTIYADWDTIVLDQWMDGVFDKIKFPVYNLFKYHGLKGPAINMFREVVQSEYDIVSDAYYKREEQAVEAYAHIKKGDKRKMMKVMETIFEDLDKLKTSAKVARAARVKKPKTSDKQVERLNYKKEDIDAKLTSINPVRIPSKSKLYVYNTKQRKLVEYISNSMNGFEVKGSTLYNWDEDMSKITTLRKPDEILPQILNKTERQITSLWDTFTTKINKPTGRINKDCILLRVE